MHLKTKENLFLVMTMMSVFLLSFIEYKSMYFIVSLPIALSLIFVSEKYFLASYFMIILASLFTNHNYVFFVVLMGLLTSIFFFVLYRRIKINLAYIISFIAFVTGAIYSLITYIYTNNQDVILLLYPFTLLAGTYLFSKLIIDQKSKDDFSFTQIELMYLAATVNFIILKSNLSFLYVDISLVLSCLFTYSLVQINTNSALISTLLSALFYMPFTDGLKSILIILPLIFIVRFIAKFIKTRAILFMAMVLTLSSVFRDFNYIEEGVILTVFYLIIPETVYLKFGKYLIDPKDYKIKRYKEMYYSLLNKDKKVNSLLEVIEEKIQDNPRMKKKYSDKLSEDLRFLIDKSKEEYDKDIKEKILEELEYLDIDLISLKLIKDYQDEIKNIMETRFYSDYKKLINIIENISKKKMIMELCKYNFLTNSIRYEFVSQEEYEFDYFVRQRSVDNKCGDNYLCFKANNKKYFLISDGMGHGDKASEDSKFALYLIKNFIELGMDTKKAIESCNALIYSKSDTYNTLDLLEYNCFNNDIVLYKNGSGNSYVEYQNKIDKLFSEILPLGIVDEINIKKLNIKENAKRIVLTSDGVSENLLDILNESKNESAKTLVNKIFSKYEDYNDDQTIMAINVIKR